MVDSINNGGPISTLLRAQSTIASLNNSQQTTQTIIDRAANGAKPTTVQPTTKIVSPNDNLPRGSLVDILA